MKNATTSPKPILKKVTLGTFRSAQGYLKNKKQEGLTTSGVVCEMAGLR